MARITKTFGQLPTREQFDLCWDETEKEGRLRDGLFHFGNDKRVGTCAMDREELWQALEKGMAEYHADVFNVEQEDEAEEVGDWLSAVLGCLGVEWV